MITNILKVKELFLRFNQDVFDVYKIRYIVNSIEHNMNNTTII